MVAKQHRAFFVPVWLLVTMGILFVLNILPFLAPVFMEAGLAPLGKAIYTLYMPMCHQMAQRSFFLFGPGGFQMYDIAQLPVNLTGLSITEEMQVLRYFRGNDLLGWKVAWSDRMVYMYTAPLLVAVWYAVARRRREIKPLPLWVIFLLLLPMAIDGTTHWLSDLPGLTAGFRYDNAWLAILTGNAFPKSFYVGDSLGSFNSLMRLLSGITFGIGLGGFIFPYMDETFSYLKKEPETPSDAGYQAG